MSNPGAWAWEKKYEELVKLHHNQKGTILLYMREYQKLQTKYEEAKKTNTLLCLENEKFRKGIDELERICEG